MSNDEKTLWKQHDLLERTNKYYSWYGAVIELQVIHYTKSSTAYTFTNLDTSTNPSRPRSFWLRTSNHIWLA